MKRLIVFPVIRRTIAALSFTALLIYFFTAGNVNAPGLSGQAVNAAGAILVKTQLIPALSGALAGIFMSAFFFAIISLSALLFGRIYCSTVCPLGILQDLSIFARKTLKRKIPLIRGKFIIWYASTAIFIFFIFNGFGTAAGIMDPFSLFGKTAAYALRPIAVYIHNTAGSLFEIFGFYPISPAVNTSFIPEFFAALFVFTVLLLTLAFFKGRFFCNVLCPAGAYLGMLSRFSLFKLSVHESCTGCGKCEQICRSGCIDIKNKTIVNTRCVRCMDCRDICTAGSIRIVRLKTFIKRETGSDAAVVNRRTMIISGGSALFLAMMPAGIAASGIFARSKHPFPPGGKTRESFMAKCTGCGLCVSKCPTGVLIPAFLENGLGGFAQPLLDFRRGFCEYACTVCSSVCPSCAIMKITSAAKKTLSIGKAEFIESRCIVKTQNTACGACAEVCPTHAVTMIPYKEVLTIPHTDSQVCIGCGACEHQCPVRPLRAIIVTGSDRHTDVKTAIEARDNKAEEKTPARKKKKPPSGDFPF